MLARALETPGIGTVLAAMILKDAGIGRLRGGALPDRPTWEPRWGGFPAVPGLSREDREGRIGALHRAFLDDHLTPEAEAERFLSEQGRLDRGRAGLGGFIALDAGDIRSQAAAASARYRAGRPRSVLDGVPVAVKDEIDCLPYPTSRGAGPLDGVPEADAVVVARLRAAGAVIAGKTQMHDQGLGITGWNPRDGAVRNPWLPTHYAGGSSGGSAAVVAAGLVPGALGLDGGGSIRIPAAFCGIVGLKPTFGRISRAPGALDSSVAYVGPLAATAADAEHLLMAIRGRDPADRATGDAPPDGVVSEGQCAPVIGLPRDWVSEADPVIAGACEEIALRLGANGFRIEGVTLPGPDPETVQAAHLVTLLAEMISRPLPSRADSGSGARSLRRLAHGISAADFLAAQRIRTAARNAWRRLLERVDTVLTPATGCLPPPLPVNPVTEMLDPAVIRQAMRFAVGANLTGLPAGVVRAGISNDGRPIGAQLIGPPWSEALLLAVMERIEALRDPAEARVCVTRGRGAAAQAAEPGGKTVT